ncbi:Hint domain-containing protein, partial [Methylobrevis albus]
MGNGINLNAMNGADSVSSGPEGDSQDNFVYNVDVSPGETVTLTGNWDNITNGDGAFNSDNGSYATTNGPDFGTFSLDPASGAMSWTFTYDELMANGGPDSIIFNVSGQDFLDEEDIDTVTVNITCFVGGTLIATPAGEVPVESLAIGDLVLTADGRAVPVKWIGRQTIANHVFLSDRMRPVCIAAGALGSGVPHTDLYLSADHGMIVDGLVVNAGALV